MKVIVIACAGALASCTGPSPETSRIPSSTSSRADPSLASQLFQEVNIYRRNHGSHELRRHAGLDSLAQQHSEFLRNNRGKLGFSGKESISHTGIEGRALVARQRYNMLSCAENVAFTPGTSGSNDKIAHSLVSNWVKSRSHEKNMNGSWTHTGIGIVKDSDGTVFSTQLFGAVSDSQMTTRNRFNGF